MRLYEILDKEDFYGWSLLYGVSLNKEELMAYYHMCKGDTECILNKLETYNPSFSYIIAHKGRDEARKLLNFYLKKYNLI